MAYAVLQAVCVRLEREGRLQAELPDSLLIFEGAQASSHPSPLVERPPLVRLPAAA
jgi:hypothetical protein